MFIEYGEMAKDPSYCPAVFEYCIIFKDIRWVVWKFLAPMATNV
jgi:hypothetical protein